MKETCDDSNHNMESHLGVGIWGDIESQLCVFPLVRDHTQHFVTLIIKFKAVRKGDKKGYYRVGIVVV